MTPQIDAMTALYTRLMDSREGYGEALAQAGPDDLLPLFAEMHNRRTADSAAVGTWLAAAGQPSEETGSFMASVNRTIVYLRAKLTGLDEGALAGVIDGETRILSLYSDAIAASVGQPDCAFLDDQATSLAAKIGELEAWRTRVGA